MTAVPNPEPEESVDLFAPHQPANPRQQFDEPAAERTDLHADLRSAIQRMAELERQADAADPGRTHHHHGAQPAGRRRMRLPRSLHRFWAGLTGRFWKPCPVCEQYFGGHEWRTKAEDRGGHVTTVWDDERQMARAICPDCTRKGEGCKSHALYGRMHAQCPFLLGRSRPKPDEGETVEP